MHMRSVFFFALLIGAAGTRHVSAEAAPLPYDDTHAVTYTITAAPLTASAAPADEYFGRLKLSNLGVRNIVHDITIEGNSPLALPRQETRLMGVRTALAEWASKYPRDRWLPGAIMRFAALLESKQQPLYDQTAFSLWSFLLQSYPNSYYSKYALSQLRKYQELPNIDVLNAPDVHEVANVIDYEFAKLH